MRPTRWILQLPCNSLVVDWVWFSTKRLLWRPFIVILDKISASVYLLRCLKTFRHFVYDLRLQWVSNDLSGWCLAADVVQIRDILPFRLHSCILAKAVTVIRSLLLIRIRQLEGWLMGSHGVVAARILSWLVQNWCSLLPRSRCLIAVEVGECRLKWVVFVFVMITVYNVVQVCIGGGATSVTIIDIIAFILLWLKHLSPYLFSSVQVHGILFFDLTSLRSWYFLLRRFS